MIRFLLILTLSSTLYAQPSIKYIESSLQKAAVKNKVSADLLRAICWRESKLKADAYNHHDADEGNSAFGICQVLYLTAVSHGFKDAKCAGSFEDKGKSYQTCKLFGPYTSAYYGARYLKYQLERYGGSWIHAIGAYNTGTFMICRDGTFKIGDKKKKCRIGFPINWEYIMDVINYINRRQ